MKGAIHPRQWVFLEISASNIFPKPVIHRAEEMLEQLESGEFRPGTPAIEPSQPALFATEHPVVEELRALDVPQMTPLDAINALYELQRKTTEE